MASAPGRTSEIRTGPLEEGRRAAEQLRWHDAHVALGEADRRSPLSAEDLELLATAAFLRGRPEEARQARLRAYHVHLDRGDGRRAARCAARIGLDQLGAGEIAAAVGCLPASLSTCSAWVAQAAELLGPGETSAEHGYLLIPEAYERLAMDGDPVAAAETAGRAVDIARRFRDAEVLSLGLAIQGRALVRSARVHEGIAQLEAAVAAALAEDPSPPVAGLVLTAAVAAAEEAFDVGRLDDWTGILATWCDRHQGLIAFRSRSLAHRSTVDLLHGRWSEALRNAEGAGEAESARADRTAAATAGYRRGEILRLRGEWSDAEAAYREADRLGHDPQPGLALLRLAEGETDAAVGAIGRILAETRGRLDRARMLPAAVEILLDVGDLARAADAADELGTIAAEHAVPALEATARHADGAVLLAEDRPLEALTPLRNARRVWRHLDVPFEEARARALIARCCLLAGDRDTARLELDAARSILVRLGARPGPILGRSGLEDPPAAGTHGLTPRELEVLRLLATGLTNRAIAEELTVTVKTVDTHVSSILTKLGVSSRSAATAFAHEHRLV